MKVMGTCFVFSMWMRNSSLKMRGWIFERVLRHAVVLGGYVKGERMSGL